MSYQTIELARTGDRPLRGRMKCIGAGESGSGGSGMPCDWHRGVDVRIYRREKGGYAWSRRYWSQWQGERTRYEAGVADTALELLEQLRGEGGELLHAEAEAWGQAADQDDGIDAERCEEV
jgi:hypothetical protein